MGKRTTIHMNSQLEKTIEAVKEIHGGASGVIRAMSKRYEEMIKTSTPELSTEDWLFLLNSLEGFGHSAKFLHVALEDTGHPALLKRVKKMSIPEKTAILDIKDRYYNTENISLEECGCKIKGD